MRINAQLFAAWLDQRARSLDYIELTVQMRPEGYTGLYNAACASAIQGERDRALKLPDRAVSNGRGYLRWIGSDADLANLCGDPRFEAIVHRIRSMDQPAA